MPVRPLRLLALLGILLCAGCNPPTSSSEAPPPRLVVSVKLPALDGGAPATPGPSVWVGPDGIAVGEDLDGTKATSVTNLVGGYRSDGGVGVIVPLEADLKTRRGSATALVVFADESVPAETLGWVLATASVAGFTQLQLALGTPDEPRVVPLALPRDGIVDPKAAFDWGYPADLELWWDRGTLLARAVARTTPLAPAPLLDPLQDRPPASPVPVDLGQRECTIAAPAGRPEVGAVAAALTSVCTMPAQTFRLRMIPKPASSVGSMAAVLVAASSVEACQVEPFLFPPVDAPVPECRRPKVAGDLPEHMKPPPPPPPPVPVPEPDALTRELEAVRLLGVLGDPGDGADIGALFGDGELDGLGDLDRALGGLEGVAPAEEPGGDASVAGIGVITDLDD